MERVIFLYIICFAFCITALVYYDNRLGSKISKEFKLNKRPQFRGKLKKEENK